MWLVRAFILEQTGHRRAEGNDALGRTQSEGVAARQERYGEERQNTLKMMMKMMMRLRVCQFFSLKLSFNELSEEIGQSAEVCGFNRVQKINANTSNTSTIGNIKNERE